MKYFLIALLFVPSTLFAHVSDQRYIDGFIVDLSTAPVAPWVGEKVGMSFVFRDPSTGVATTSVISAHLEIDALMRPRTKLQEIIYTSSSTPVENGGLITSYVFSEEGTYDIHITFVDEDGVSHTTGFRKQIRVGEVAQAQSIEFVPFIVTILIVVPIAFVAGRLSRKK